MERRDFVAGAGVVLTTGLAGCSGSSDDNGDGGDDNGNGNGDDNGDNGDTGVPDSETPTSDLLPDTDEWPLDEENDQEAGAIGANDGVQGRWDGPDDDRYTMEIMRFGEEESAEEAAEGIYGDWFMSFAHGVFSFAVNGEDGEHARDLLAASPALDRDTVDSKT